MDMATHIHLMRCEQGREIVTIAFDQLFYLNFKRIVFYFGHNFWAMDLKTFVAKCDQSINLIKKNIKRFEPSKRSEDRIDHETMLALQQTWNKRDELKDELENFDEKEAKTKFDRLDGWVEFADDHGVYLPLFEYFIRRSNYLALFAKSDHLINFNMAFAKYLDEHEQKQDSKLYPIYLECVDALLPRSPIL